MRKSNEMKEREMLALLHEFTGGDYETNLVMAEYSLNIRIYGHSVMVESVWRDGNGDYYLHVCDKEFEGDLEAISLNDKNQALIRKCLVANMEYEDKNR